MLQRRPALRFVLLFTAGILLATWISIPHIWSFRLTIILTLLSIILFWLGKWPVAAASFLQCSVVLLGLLLHSLQQAGFRSREIEPSIAGEQVVLFGTVDSKPLQQERRLSFVIAADTIIRYERVERESRRVMTSIRLSNGELEKEIEVGQRIELHGSLQPFPFRRNPGEFDFGKYLELNNIQGIVSAKGLQSVTVHGEADMNFLQSTIYSVQRKLYRIIDSLHSARHASFLKGIIFGYRDEIPPDIKQSFLDTGTIHILAVSGSNVAFVTLMLFSLFCLFRLPRKAVVAATVFGLIAYMVVTGSSASVVRATIMAIVLLGGTLFERKSDIYNSISVAAIILLIWDTNTIFDVGFQLSFAAVISIVYFYPHLERIIKLIPGRIGEIKAMNFILKLFAVSLAAQLGTIPFTAYYFGRVSVISLLANIPVVPISGLNTYIGFAEVIFYFVSPWFAMLYAAANDLLVWLLLGFVKQAAGMPFAYLETLNLSTAFVTGYYSILFGLFNVNSPRVRAWILIFLLILGNYTVYADIWSVNHPRLTATIIDVGQGDAVLLTFHNGKRLLIDAGPSSQQFDAGERIIVPFLKRSGITKLDYLLVTHPHNDHYGGVNSILKSMQVGTLIMNPPARGSRNIENILNTAHARNVRVKDMLMGDRINIDSSARMYVLYPNHNGLKEKNANNSSIVIKAVFGDVSMLLVGDAEAELERKMILRYGEFLSSDIIKVGHHGSISSTSEEFLKVVQPRRAVISVGINNKFRHPSQFTLSRLAARSIEMGRTDKSGAIILENDGRRWVQREWRKELIAF